jgi:hypothetical protein
MSGRLGPALRRNLALKLVSIGLAVLLYLLLRSTGGVPAGSGPAPAPMTHHPTVETARAISLPQ